MNAFLLSMAFKVQDVLVRPYVYGAVRTLEATKEYTAMAVGDAIRDAFAHNLSESERERINAIESVRKQLNESNEKIEIVDYGAHADPEKGTIVHRKVGDVAVSSSKPYRWSLLLFLIVERLEPVRCLEFGTCLGISTMYQAAALEMNSKGSIVTMEGAPSLAGIAEKNFSQLRFKNIVSTVGRFDDLLPSVTAAHGPFDYVFIDGHHEGKATVRYFMTILPSLPENAVVIFDDIHWSAGMKKAWQEIIAHEKVKYSVDLYQLGIIIIQ